MDATNVLVAHIPMKRAKAFVLKLMPGIIPMKLLHRHCVQLVVIPLRKANRSAHNAMKVTISRARGNRLVSVQAMDIIQTH